jgi:VanZ family protein
MTIRSLRHSHALLIKRWWPAVTWAGVIFFFSTEYFAAPQTGHFLIPLLSWLFPTITPQQIEFAHLLVRKSGHLSEYFIFAVLLMRALQGDQQRLPNYRCVFWTLATILVYAASDEFHQFFVAGRTATPRDVIIDFSGALCGTIWIYWHRKRLEPGSVSLQ